MCGIIGVLATREATPLLLEGLRRLEYRGYDSAGVATVRDGRLAVRRAVGKLARLSDALAAAPLEGEVGIGHTRWATHGPPTETNAHPHRAGPVAVVHNGIIENFRELREALAAAGHATETDTDTEVVAMLCAQAMASGLSPVDAVAATLPKLRGAFALCFAFDGAEDLLICARRGSPLAIGYGDGEMFIGSDALGLAPFTNRIAYLEEGDWAAVTRSGAHVFDIEGRPVSRPVRNIALDSAMVDKGGHRHFMAKEIHEQPTALAHVVSAYGEGGGHAAAAASVDWASLSRLTMVACGTAFYAAMVAKYWFESIARLPVEVDIASEFRYRTPPLPAGGAALFVSQSGETADTLAALRHARAEKQIALSVVNIESSSMARESDLVFPILAGPEIGVASTKAFTAQLAVLGALAITAAQARGAVDAPTAARLRAALAAAPNAVMAVIEQDAAIAAVAAELASARSMLYLGRGPTYPIALEGALKMKELTYIHAEGYAAGELKHGPIALIDGETPVIALAPRDALFEKLASNVQEVAARRGRVVLFSDPEAVATIGAPIWRSVALPPTESLTTPFSYAVALQLLAYHCAVAKGADVDQPRNLAKSVTVE